MRLGEESRVAEITARVKATAELGEPHYSTPATEDEPGRAYWNTAAGIVVFCYDRKGRIDPRTRQIISRATLAIYTTVTAHPEDPRFT